MTSLASRSSGSSGPAGHGNTVGGRMLDAADRAGGVALTRPGTDPLAYPALAEAVREIAAGLVALGIAPGDRVAILAGTRPEWTLADAGSLCAAATVVPIYQTNSPEECEYVLAHAEVRAVFCEDVSQLDKVRAVRARCPALEHVILFEGDAPDAMPLAGLRAAGAGGAAVVEERLASVAPADVATIVYTSGTTGPPKGCRLTHANLLATVEAYDAQLGLSAQEDLVVYLFLPLAHALARVAQIAVLQSGGTLAFWGGDPQQIVAELPQVRPTHFPSVPRIYEKIHAAVVTGVGEQGRAKQLVFRWAVGEGRRRRAVERAGGTPGALATLRHRLADRLVLARVRAVFGDRLVAALCGAAPISADVLEFFDACGVLTLEGYGMTETCAAATLNTPQAVRFGTVGRALPGTEIAIADDGEVLMAGPHVFDGYHRDPGATAEVMDGRWLRSGDLGAIDEDGYLRITGRKKDLIITSSGKNISPENLESALRETRWISSAVVAGDRRSYLVALLTLDPDELPHLAAELGLEGDPASLTGDPRVREAIQAEVDAVNTRFARIEQIKRFAILDRDFSQDEGELTPTLKIKRAVVLEHFAGEIAQLYGEDGAAR